MKETIMHVAAFITFFAFGFLVANIKRWIDEELPVRREIKRRMNQPRPRDK